MSTDIFLALGRSTCHHQTLFGINYHKTAKGPPGWQKKLGRCFEPGETIRTPFLEIPQPRQSYTVFGCQAEDCCGFHHGINEHGVVMGLAGWQSKLSLPQSGFLGGDLVVLVLQRSRSARQGLDWLTDLISRYGQGTFPGCTPDVCDHIFVIADAQEAFVVEAAGPYWATLECHQVRAVTDVSLVNQDWDRLSPGLAEKVLQENWWPDDGSKINFAKSLQKHPYRDRQAFSRWGRAMRFLEQQNGHIDENFFRRILCDHWEEWIQDKTPALPILDRPTPFRPKIADSDLPSCTSFFSTLNSDPHYLPLTWVSFGPPSGSIFFPVVLVGEIPEEMGSQPENPKIPTLWSQTQILQKLAIEDPARFHEIQKDLALLQERIDMESHAFLKEAANLRRLGEEQILHRSATSLMQNMVHWFETELEHHQLLDRPTSLAFSHSPFSHSLVDEWFE